MEVKGTIKKPLWYDIKCKCDHDSVETEFPIAECKHCKFQAQEDSLPKKDFKVKENHITIDKDGKETSVIKTKTVKEITIVRGDKYQDIVGWTF